VCVCVCYATSALVCCCITMLQSQHTNVSHVVISVVVACFGLVRLLLRPLTPPPRTCVCLCFGALSLVKVWAFSPPEKTNHLNTLSWSFIGGIVHISRVLCQVFHHNLSTESSCASFPLAGFPFWLLGFFVGPLNVCRLLCKLPPKWLLWFGSSQRKF